jgi:hypothetical protein
MLPFSYWRYFLAGLDRPGATWAETWVVPILFELFALPFAWIAVQSLHDKEPWSGILEFGATGVVLSVVGAVWIYFRKRLAEIWPWAQLRSVKVELAKVQQENLELTNSLNAMRELAHTRQPSGLKIISATWGIEGIGVYDVKSELVERQHGDSLAERVTVGLFHGRDPLEGNPSKVLKVRYSLDDQEATIVRREWSWIVLPENRLLEERLGALQWKLEQAKKVESVAIAVNGVPVAGRATHVEERAGQEVAKQSLGDLLSPLQIEALKIAKELRDFLASLPPFPADSQKRPDEEEYDYIVRVNSIEQLQKVFQEQREKQGQWRQKLIHGYANRKFGERITTLMHHAGEEEEYPVLNAKFAEKPPMTELEVYKLAQGLEGFAMWVNHKNDKTK